MVYNIARLQVLWSPQTAVLLAVLGWMSAARVIGACLQALQRETPMFSSSALNGAALRLMLLQGRWLMFTLFVALLVIETFPVIASLEATLLPGIEALSTWVRLLRPVYIACLSVENGLLIGLLACGVLCAGQDGRWAQTLWLIAGVVLQFVVALYHRVFWVLGGYQGHPRSYYDVAELSVWLMWFTAPLLYLAVLTATRAGIRPRIIALVLIFAACTFAVSVTRYPIIVERVADYPEVAVIANVLAGTGEPLLLVPFQGYLFNSQAAVYFEGTHDPIDHRWRETQRYTAQLYSLELFTVNSPTPLALLLLLANAVFLWGVYRLIVQWLADSQQARGPHIHREAG